MSRLPSIQTLRAFEAAARHESYSAAAAELGLTHGAISHRIRELEEGIGVSLFRRTGGKMVPTREAVTLLAQVREALSLLQRALPSPVRKQAGRLVISIHPSLATHWLVHRVGGFLRTAPGISMEIRSTADLGEFLGRGVDIAIRYGTGNWPNAGAERLSGEVLFPVCSPEYRDAHRIRTPADLRRCTLLRHGWQPWLPWLKAANLKMPEPTTGLMLSDTGILIEAAAAGEGVALARSLFVLDALKSGRLVRLFDISIEDSYAYYATWPLGAPRSALAEAFIAWLRSEVATAPIVNAAERPESTPTRRRSTRR
jgi:LysR family glycine cleavage system transcriptional activator